MATNYIHVRTCTYDYVNVQLTFLAFLQYLVGFFERDAMRRQNKIVQFRHHLQRRTVSSGDLRYDKQNYLII